MELALEHLLVAVAAAAGLGGGVGWLVHRVGESSRAQAHEAYCREMVNVAATARDRVRQEKQQLEERIGTLQLKHNERGDTLRLLEERLASFGSSEYESAERIETLQRNLAEIEAQLEVTRSDRAALQQQLEGREAARLRTRQDVDAARAAATRAAERFQRRDAEARDLEQQAASLEEVREKADERKEKLETMANDVRQKDVKIRELKAQVAKLDDVQELARQHETSLGELEERVRQRSERVRVLDDKFAALRAVHTGCSNTIASLKDRVAELEGVLEEQDRARAEGRPAWLLSGPQRDRDDLQLIKGIGPAIEERLNKIGVYHYRQLVRLTRQDAEWIAERIQISADRIEREHWAKQAWAMQTREKNIS